MRMVIVADAGDKTGEAGRLYLAQIRSLLRRMREEERLEPVLVCPAGSILEDTAKEAFIPSLPAARPGDLLRTLKLWQWQRRTGRMGVLVVGEAALSAARLLMKLRGKRDTFLSFAFFRRAPANEIRDVRFLGRGNLFFCGTRAIAGEIEKMTGSEAACRAIPPGLDIALYRIARPQGNAAFDENRNFAFGMAGSLSPQSGALLVIRAMAAIWQKRGLPPWEVRMFGGGPRYEEILREAGNLGVSARLSLLDEQDLPDVCGLCDAWLAPGFSPDEGPEILWSGVAAGLPLICSRTPLHEERLPADAAVLKTGEDDPQKLASAMIAVLESGNLRREMVAGMEKWREYISADRMAREVCEDLMKSARLD
ncbi:MAG: glycosyltransferase family 4 protein [Desulfovibrio sp.]|nr:glycosyltransferase family 4 protein [Desulfovibrio sp.]